MKSKKYIIPEISAQSIILSAKETDEGYAFCFDATEPSREYLVEKTLQDDCPIFYQAMLTLSENPSDDMFVSNKLQDVFVYVDFSGTFDRKPIGKVADYQRIAEYMFRPEGIILNLKKEYKRYIAFERSASMSRENRLSFVREDVYEQLRERMMLGMDIGKCQLSKLYAYNALLFTSGTRCFDDSILDADRIIVVKNPESIVENVNTVTVEDDGTDNATRKYIRKEAVKDIKITEFDGEGLISPRFAEKICGEHNSIQIRLPYIKGVVHKVNFASMLSELNVTEITDMWGNTHNVNDVDIILTESMFKGLKWMESNNLSWQDYLDRCKKYSHALYVSGTDKTEVQTITELNYQFLNTLSITDDEFRPKDLPLGWNVSPEYYNKDWITKTTETEYYHLVADYSARCKYFTDELQDNKDKSRRKYRSKLIAKNALYIDEPIYTKELIDRAENILSKYSLGKLLVKGDNRYLSDDLLRLIAYISNKTDVLSSELLSGNLMYAPKPAYEENEFYTILRSPHIARNEEVLAKPITEGYFRKKYLSHLSYVLMVDSRSLIPERLGGADFDGDMVKTIADKLINECVKRSSTDLPLLKIPTAEPLIADANDWFKRFKTVRNTFSSRVGQISNAALRRGIVAYDENTNTDEKEKYRQEVETLAILTGLEIDSAKSGIKPDLSDYIEKKTAKKSMFLRYKYIICSDDNHKWYEPSKNERLKKFFNSVDWDNISSNLEKLPYLAYMLQKETKKVVPKPVNDEQLFAFAQEYNWKDNLNPDTLNRVKSLISDYNTALKRVLYVRHISTDMKRKNDIQRILFARGQENDYTVDELYSVFDDHIPQQIRRAWHTLKESNWQFLPEEERKNVLLTICTTSKVFEYVDVFCDFRCGGYRILGDIICDFEEMYENIGKQKHFTAQKGDSKVLEKLLIGVKDSSDYKEQIIRNCINVIRPVDKRNTLDYTDVVKCAVALGERKFVFEVLPSVALDLTNDRSNIFEDTTPKKKWRFWK